MSPSSLDPDSSEPSDRVVNNPVSSPNGSNNVVGDAQAANSAKTTPVKEKPVYREIKAVEYQEGDPPVRYFLKIPQDIEYYTNIKVDLGGRIMTVNIPDYINRGEKIVIVAPAPDV
jgi:hypothetical protein